MSNVDNMAEAPVSGFLSRWGVFLLSRWIPFTLIAMVGFIAYSGSLSVPFEMDDHNIPAIAAGKLENILLHGGTRRVTDLTFALNFRFSGLSLPAYHLTNLVIHITSAIVLYLLTRVLFLSLTPPVVVQRQTTTYSEHILPLAVALLFVCHPVQTQAVTYIVQRYSLLATLLYLLAVYGYVNARRASVIGDPGRILWLWGSFSALAAVLAFGAKQIAYTLPLMLIVFEYIVFRGRLFNRRFILVCGCVATGVVLLGIYQWWGDGADGFLFDLRHATAEDTTISRSNYFFTQLRVIVTYLRLLCLPVHQSLFHDYPLSTTLMSLPVLGALTLHFLLLAVAVTLLRFTNNIPEQRNASRYVLQRLAAIGIIWFYLAMSIESSLFPIRDVIFEHRVYLPSYGFFLAICALAGLLIQERYRRIQVAGVLLTLTCLILTGLTIARNRIWNNPLRLWQEAVQEAPNNSLALANLANKLLVNNQPDKALLLYVRAFEINPNMSFRPLVDLGIALKMLNIPGERFITGEEFVLASGELDFGRFSEWEAVKCNNLGLAFEIMGVPDKARKRYESAVIFRPDYDLAWLNLGLLAKSQRDDVLLARALVRLRLLNPSLVHLLE